MYVFIMHRRAKLFLSTKSDESFFYVRSLFAYISFCLIITMSLFDRRTPVEKAKEQVNLFDRFHNQIVFLIEIFRLIQLADKFVKKNVN